MQGSTRLDALYLKTETELASEMSRSFKNIRGWMLPKQEDCVRFSHAVFSL
jgi:hypothetical protein